MANPNNTTDSLDRRSLDELNGALKLAGHTVYKQYLNELSAYPLVAPNQLLLDEDIQHCLRMFRLTKLSCKKGEDMFQKLSTVYHSAMSLGCSLFIMADVPGINQPTEIYLGIRSPEGNPPERLSTSYSALREGLLSNFPGTEVEGCFDTNERTEALIQKLDSIFGEEGTACVSSVSCVASARDKSKTEHKSFIQGIEKLIDVMRGRPYTAILIAEPISVQQQREIRSGYESLYSALSSFQKSIWSYSENQSSAVMETLSHGISETITQGTSHTQSHAITQAHGTTNTIGFGVNGGLGQTNGTARPTIPSRVGAALTGGGVGQAVGMLVSLIPGVGAIAPFLGMAIDAAGSAMQGGTIVESLTKSLGLNGNFAHGWIKNTANMDGTADATINNIAKGVNDTTTKGTTDTSGTGRSLQIEMVNKSITELLQRIEEQLKRVREGEDYGAYSCGAYFLAGKPDNCLLAANTYRALMLGEGSSVESGAVNFWTDPQIVAAMKEYLRRFAQPLFALPLTEEECLPYSPGTTVSGLELPLHLGLPTQSVVGLSVMDHAEFGRNIPKAARPLYLGELYHMGQVERGQAVCLDADSLASHVFITGSTGTGKSNTVYHLLDRLAEQDVHFLVVEPAKGEYKQVFGGREDTAVYGTNAKKAPLLRMNPFSFPEDIHVLEHIDRLVEIFNACWPMYAAMPAVLKDAMEQAYRAKGWDLSESRSILGEFPTFEDLNEQLYEVMRRSAYSADTKNDYTGALVTRVKSLTNGINGQIFCARQEMSNQELFDRNVIVDISRVGSMETKALLMGVLVVKLQEYRMACCKMNASLRHVVVLEEAHHLLRSTSAVQSQESANLQGKSVEMIANAIAEMRAYGEGFIIADQAPGLLDPAVIRNTNTKIILRLPDHTDRELVGNAASLNPDQITELAKLKTGVAAVYQNEWLEPVLCQISEFKEKRGYTYTAGTDSKKPNISALFTALLYGREKIRELSQEDIDQLELWIDGLDRRRELKDFLRDVLRGKRIPSKNKIRYALYCLVDTCVVKSSKQAENPDSALAHHLAAMFQINESLAKEVGAQIFLHIDGQTRKEKDSQEMLREGGIT